MEQASLGPGVRLNLERVVVLPGDVEMCRLSHHTRRAVRFALVSFGFVLHRIPLHSRLGAFCLVRNTAAQRWVRTQPICSGTWTADRSGRPDAEVALWHAQHSQPVVFCDHCGPVPGQIDGGRRLRCWRRSAAAPAPPLSLHCRRGRKPHRGGRHRQH